MIKPGTLLKVKSGYYLYYTRKKWPIEGFFIFSSANFSTPNLIKTDDILICVDTELFSTISLSSENLYYKIFYDNKIIYCHKSYMEKAFIEFNG